MPRRLLSLAALMLGLAVALVGCGDKADPAPTPTSTSSASETPTGDAGGQPAAEDPTLEAGKRERPRAVTTTWRGEGAVLEFNVWRMHCAGCASQVKKALMTIEGVEGVETDRVTDVVTVTLNDAAKRDSVIEKAPEVLRTATRKKFTVVTP